jgi:hypothetical protein
VTPRALLLADGPSDAPLGRHVARMAQRHGHALDVVAPDLRRLDPPPGLQVTRRLEAVFRFDAAFDLVIVHRDAEGEDPATRREEVLSDVGTIRDGLPVLPVIPIRMTEAWLLLDEAAIRRVAGRPTGLESLGLPVAAAAEHVHNPKQLLQNALEIASGATGRRLRRFKRDFGAQRRRLLEGLDHTGPVSELTAWQQLEADVQEVLGRL